MKRPKKFKTRTRIVLFWSDEDSAYIADAPDVPCCSAHGPTYHEALSELLAALEAFEVVRRIPKARLLAAARRNTKRLTGRDCL